MDAAPVEEQYPKPGWQELAGQTVEPPPADPYRAAIHELCTKLEMYIRKAVLERRPWFATVKNLNGILLPNKYKPGVPTVMPDGSLAVFLVVGNPGQRLPTKPEHLEVKGFRNQRAMPPLYTFRTSDAAKPFLEFVKRQCQEADDTGKPWHASIRPLGAVEVPDPRRYGKQIITHDGSFVAVLLFGKHGQQLPHPGIVQVTW